MPPGGERAPKCLQDFRLLCGKVGDIAVPAQPLDVRMSAHHAGGRARHIGPGCGRRDDHPTTLPGGGGQRPSAPRAGRGGQVARHPTRPQRIKLQREHVRIGPLEDVCSLPPGPRQASSTRSPARASSSCAAHCAPRPAPTKRPSAYPRRRATASGRASTSASLSSRLNSSPARQAPPRPRPTSHGRIDPQGHGGRVLPAASRSCQA